MERMERMERMGRVITWDASETVGLWTGALTFGAFPKLCKAWGLCFPSVTGREFCFTLSSPLLPLVPKAAVEVHKTRTAALSLQWGNGLVELPVNLRAGESRLIHLVLLWETEVNVILGYVGNQKGITVARQLLLVLFVRLKWWREVKRSDRVVQSHSHPSHWTSSLSTV